MKHSLKLSTAVQPELFDELSASAADAAHHSPGLSSAAQPSGGRRMMMLFLRQPWASYCVWCHPFDGLAEKQIETTPWTTSYRGLLAIHATKSLTAAKSSIAGEKIFAGTLRVHAGDFRNDWRELTARLVFGAVVGVVEFYDVQTFPAGDGGGGAAWVDANYPPREKYFGNYAGGRFGWRLRNPVRFREPIPARLAAFRQTESRRGRGNSRPSR